MDTGTAPLTRTEARMLADPRMRAVWLAIVRRYDAGGPQERRAILRDLHRAVTAAQAWAERRSAGA